jgi:RNA polymerase sigma factor FliA
VPCWAAFTDNASDIVSESISAVSHEAATRWVPYLACRDSASRNVLIEHYLPLARSIAASVYKMRIDDSVAFSDFLQYGRMGLLQAVERFDPTRGIVFEAYAARRVRGAILNGLGKESEVAAQRHCYAERMRERLRSIKDQSGGERLQRLVRVTVTAAISAMLDEDYEEPPDDSLASNPYASAELSQLGRAIWARIALLSERQRNILQQHYIGGMEFQAIAQQLQLSKGRVSQLHAQALEQLRESLHSMLGQLDRRL